MAQTEHGGVEALLSLIEAKRLSHMRASDGRPPLPAASQTTSPPFDGGEVALASAISLPSSPSGGGRGGPKDRSGGSQNAYAIAPHVEGIAAYGLILADRVPQARRDGSTRLT